MSHVNYMLLELELDVVDDVELALMRSCISGQRVPNGLQQRQHEAGICKPCIFVLSAQGCIHAHACRFCHLPHRQNRRVRNTVKQQLKKTLEKQCSTQASKTAPEQQDAESVDDSECSTKASKTAPEQQDEGSLDDSVAQGVDMNACLLMQMRLDDDARGSADPVFMHPTQCHAGKSALLSSVSMCISL